MHTCQISVWCLSLQSGSISVFWQVQNSLKWSLVRSIWESRVSEIFPKRKTWRVNTYIISYQQYILILYFCIFIYIYVWKKTCNYLPRDLLRKPDAYTLHFEWSKNLPATEKPVVFVGGMGATRKLVGSPPGICRPHRNVRLERRKSGRAAENVEDAHPGGGPQQRAVRFLDFFWGEFETVKMHILKLYILYVWFVFTQVYLYKYTYSVQLAIEFQKLPMFEVIATLRTQLCSLEQSDWLHPLFQWDGLGVMNVRWFMVQND